MKPLSSFLVDGLKVAYDYGSLCGLKMISNLALCRLSVIKRFETNWRPGYSGPGWRRHGQGNAYWALSVLAQALG
jgi:hypothetical protein